MSAWAGPEGYELNKDQIGTWTSPTVDGSITEKVIYLEIKKAIGKKPVEGHPGEEEDVSALATALEELATILNSDGNTGLKEHQKQYYNALGADNISNKKLILKIVYNPENGEPETLTLSAADLEALKNINIPTIDLQDSKIANENFTVNNSHVRNLILPDGYTKDQVNTAAASCANLGSAYSYGVFKDADGSDFDSSSSFYNKGAITAYVNTGKTLRDVLIRSYGKGTSTKFDNNGCSATNFTMGNIYGITISGNAVAQDFSKTSLDFTEEGHLVFDREANEKERNKANDTRTIVGTGSSKVPAFACNTLGPNRVVSLDLSGVIINDVNNSDLTLSQLDIVGAATRQVCIPTCSSLKTLPADFLNINGIGVNQICIPGNIQVIKTRAFQNVRLDHVWTTGNASDIRYDNGIYVLESGEEKMHEGYLSYASQKSQDMDGTYYLYGTYTLPENLRLIESNAFCYENDAKVKDVYVLAIVTPECHVDAFSTIMYTGNNTFDSQSISSDGIVTREAYVQSRSRHNYITMLHYPRECGTPYIQRYTDPTREYSIATGMVDGKGATIYFPNQNEFLRAYSQGTYGYVWNAWDPTRSTDGSNEIANIRSQDPYTQTGQIQANDLYTSNTVFTNKSDRIFYDTTDGGNLTKPVGQGNYWEVTWEGQQLYPQPVTELVVDDQGNPVMVQRQAVDQNGQPRYELDNTTPGLYVRDESQEYVQATNGDYVKDYQYVEQPGQPDYNAYVATGKAYRLYNGEYITFLSDPNNFWNASGWYLKEEVYREIDLENHPEDANATQYNLETVYSYRLANEGEAGDRYSPIMETVQQTQVTKQNDYRGWHQFVLTGYAHNKNYELEPYRSYITDNDWWTVCLPFDLTYKDMVLFFGSEGGKIPYLSKLTYVVRDVANEKITLMFSKNLMKYKETVESGHVHGTISDTESVLDDNDVVLHKGVPYLIKPNLKTKIDDNGNVVIDADRTFDIKKEMYHTSDNDNCLYCRLHESSTMLDGNVQMGIVHKGIYTVPAYVINNTGDKAETFYNDNLTIALEDGSSNTYSNGTLTFKGQEYQASVSNKFTYSFVGSLYLSLMPQYAYFLGWDSKNQCAAFWYNRVNNKQEYTWNNNTGIICANWLKLPSLNNFEQRRIHRATGVGDPARWTDSDGLAVKVSNDDFGNGSSTTNAKGYTMDFGGECIFADPGYGIATSIQALPTQEMEPVQSVYTANGVYVGTSVNGLSKGVYVVNGKKYVVK